MPKNSFEGLYIHDKWDWGTKYPVIRISFGQGSFSSEDGIEKRMILLENLWVKSTITYPAGTIYYLTTKWGGGLSGVWSDYAFMDLSKSAEFVSEGFIRNQPGVYQGVMEAFATYRSPLAKGYIDYFAGARWWHNDFDYTVTVPDSRKTSRTIDWCDLIIGLRRTRPVSEPRVVSPTMPSTMVPSLA